MGASTLTDKLESRTHTLLSLDLLYWVILHVPVPYNMSYLRHVMFSYVVYIILYCNDDWRVEDGVVHRSWQQSLVAKWLGLGV